MTIIALALSLLSSISAATTSIWEGSSIEALAACLRFHPQSVANLSAALQLKPTNAHEINIKSSLTAIHQQYTKMLTSCAQAFYDALDANEQKRQATPTTPLLTKKVIPALESSELFKNDKVHPALSPFVQKYAKKTAPTLKTPWDPKEIFDLVFFDRTIFRQLSHIEVPLYILDTSEHTLPRTMSMQDANNLIPPSSPLASNELCALSAAPTLIYAKIPVLSQSEAITFVTYEINPQTTSRLQERSKYTARRKEIAQTCQGYARLEKLSKATPLQ